MCIRDSRQAEQRHFVFRHRAHDDGELGIGLFKFLGFCHDPVSYTHLRAHETVLDLVCRLLLEKKKKKEK